MVVEQVEGEINYFFMDPLEQFKINLIRGRILTYFDRLFFSKEEVLSYIYLTSYFYYLLFGLIGLMIIFLVSVYKNRLYPDQNWEFFVEFCYFFILNSCKEQLPKKEALKKFVFFFCIFFFIFIYNMIGLITYSFTVTAMLIATTTLSFSYVIGVNIIFIKKSGLKFVKFFIPSDVPILLLPMIVCIEVISHLIKPVSLGVRLFANLMAGHCLLAILAGFVIKIFIYFLHIFKIIALIPLLVVYLVCFLELGVAILQSYVFMIIGLIYYNEIIYYEKH